MKRYILAFVALIHLGSFSETKAAAEAYAEGSSSTFVGSDDSQTITFTDANGNTGTILAGDGLLPVNDASGSFKGYQAVPAHVAQQWQEEAAEPTEKTTADTTQTTAGGKVKEGDTADKTKDNKTKDNKPGK